MTKEQFITLLRTPSTINLNLVGELEDITNRFPYFQNAHLLLAKQYHGHENIRFESYLRKASAYATNRSVLYKLLKEKPEELIHITPSSEELKVEQQVTKDTPAINSKEDQQTNSPVIEQPDLSDQVLHSEPFTESSEDTTDIEIGSTTETIPETDPREILEKRLRELNDSASATENKLKSLPVEKMLNSIN